MIQLIQMLYVCTTINLIPTCFIFTQLHIFNFFPNKTLLIRRTVLTSTALLSSELFL